MRTKTLEGWHTGIRLSHIAQSKAAAQHTRMHRVLGIPVVIATTVVGTTVFATLGQQQHIAVVVTTGLLSVAAAVLSSLQTFLSYSASAERHKFAAVKYGMLRRELEQFLEDRDDSQEVLKEFMSNFRARWDQVDQESPPVAEHVHDMALKSLERYLIDEERRGGSRPAEAAAELAQPAPRV
jgi:hypothetical protein